MPADDDDDRYNFGKRHCGRYTSMCVYIRKGGVWAKSIRSSSECIIMRTDVYILSAHTAVRKSPRLCMSSRKKERKIAAVYRERVCLEYDGKPFRRALSVYVPFRRNDERRTFGV